MVDVQADIKIFVIVKDSTDTKFLLQTTKSGLSFIRGKSKAIDASYIYGAARILTKKLYNESRQSLGYLNNEYLYWAQQFTEAQIIRDDNGNCSFVIEISTRNLPAYTNQKLQLLQSDDLQADYPRLYKDYQLTLQELTEAHEFYQNPSNGKNNYAIFNCEANPDWEGFYEALYMGWFKNKGEEWKTYKINLCEFPSEEEIKKLKGIVISGSEWSVYDSTVKAIPVFIERLRNLIKDHPDIKIVGVCFGCQSLATALGGKVKKMSLGATPMLMNREKLQLSQDFTDKMSHKLIAPQAPKIVEAVHIVECHGDAVSVLPEGATLYATSEKTPIEIWGYGEQIIALQGHPEFNASIMTDKILPEVKLEFADKYDMETVIDASEKSLNSGSIDQQIINGMLERFLKTRYCC